MFFHVRGDGIGWHFRARKCPDRNHPHPPPLLTLRGRWSPFPARGKAGGSVRSLLGGRQRSRLGASLRRQHRCLRVTLRAPQGGRPGLRRRMQSEAKPHDEVKTPAEIIGDASSFLHSSSARLRASLLRRGTNDSRLITPRRRRRGRLPEKLILFYSSASQLSTKASASSAYSESTQRCREYTAGP